MKKILQIAVLILCVSSLARAQQKQSLSAAAATCTTTGTSCLITSVDPQAGGVTLTVTTNASGNTLQFEASGDGGTTWVALNATPSNSTTAATSTTSTGTWQANIAAYTNVRIRMSTLVSGTSTVSIIYSIASARAGGGGGGNGTGINYVTTNPGTSTAGQTFFNTTTHQLLCASATNTLVDCIRDNGGFNTIYAGSPEYGGRFDGKYETDCTIAASTTMTCPSGQFIITDIGKIDFGTSYASTVTAVPSGTLICSHTATSPTSITGVTSTTVVTLNDACSTTCTPTVTQLCGNAWYTQVDDAAITAAENAAWTTPGNRNYTLMLPSAPMFLKINHFGGAGGNNATGDPDAAQWGPELSGQGMKSSVIIPPPDYVFADCTNGGANGASGSSCFGGIGGLVAHDFSIYGLGQSLPTTTHAVNIWDMNGNTTFWNSSQCTSVSAIKMRIAQWGSQSTSMVGFNVEGSCDVDIQDVTVEEAGETECQFAPISDTTTIIGLTSTTCFGCLKICVNITGAGTWESTGGYFGGLLANAADIFALPGGGPNYVNSFSDVIFGEEPFTNVFGFLVTSTGVTKITLSGDRLSLNSTDGASSWMFDMAGGAGSQVDIYGSTITDTGANNGMFLLSTGNFVVDACGNTFNAGSIADSFTGTAYISNCGSEPSYSGRCLLASAASPLACLSASNGKVAIPTTTATYTINTKTVQSGSVITLTPTTDNTGIPGGPTCVLPTLTADPSISATSANTSFTIAETSTTGITCYNWSVR